MGLLRCSVHLFNWVPNVVLNFKIAILNLLSDKTEKYIEWTHDFTIQTQVISIWHEIQPKFSIRKIRIIWMSKCFPLLNNLNYHCTSGFALLKLQTDQPMFYTLCTVIRLSLWPNSFTISSISSTVTTDSVSKEFLNQKCWHIFCCVKILFKAASK